MTAFPDTHRDDELLIQRTFDAPVALVFRLWEDRDHMIRWWGPEKFTCTALDWEMTPGRGWHSTMAAKDWGMTGMGGVIREVERNKRIVFTVNRRPKGTPYRRPIGTPLWGSGLQ